MGKSSPAPPSYAGMNAAQQEANRQALYDATRYSQIGETTPYGSVRYEGPIGSAERERVIELDPLDQQRLDQQRQLGLAMSEFAGGNLMDQMTGMLGAAPISTGDLLQGAQDVERATYDRGMGLLAPQFEEQNLDLDTMLQARGIPVGSMAYGRERDRLERSQNQALENLALSAVGAGRQEQTRLQQLDAARRGQIVNELAAVMGGGPVISGPQVGAPAQYGPMPVDAAGMMQADFANQMAGYDRGAQGLGGLYNVAGTIAGNLPWEQWLG